MHHVFHRISDVVSVCRIHLLPYVALRGDWVNVGLKDYSLQVHKISSLWMFVVMFLPCSSISYFGESCIGFRVLSRFFHSNPFGCFRT